MSKNHSYSVQNTAVFQYCKYINVTERPEDVKEIIDEENFQKSRLYKIDKARFGFIRSVYSQLELTVKLFIELLQ